MTASIKYPIKMREMHLFSSQIDCVMINYYDIAELMVGIKAVINVKNKLGLSVAKLRFSCASTLSLNGRE